MNYIRTMTETRDREKALSEAGKYYAKAYMLMTIASSYCQMGDDALAGAGLFGNQIKQYANRTSKAHDNFVNYMKRFLKEVDSSFIMKDYDRIEPQIDSILEKEL